MKKKWILLVFLVIILLGVGVVAVWKISQKNNSTNQPTRSPKPPLNELSDQELEKCLLENFSRRLELKKYFVFNLGELTKEEAKLPRETWVNGRVVNPSLERHLSKLSNSHNAGKKKIIVFVDKEGSGVSEEWKGEKLNERIDKKRDYVVFEKNARIEYNFFPFGKNTITNLVFLEVKVPSTTICESKEKALEILKTDPALAGKV